MMKGIDEIVRHLLDVILHHPGVLLARLLPGQEAGDPRPAECLHQPALATLPDFTGNVKQGSLNHGMTLITIYQFSNVGCTRNVCYESFCSANNI